MPGGKDYASPRFAVQQSFVTDRSGALNGTLAATELMRYTFRTAAYLNAVYIRCAVGGTEASVRQILIGRSLAGTGAFSVLGTQALGTMANGIIVNKTVTGTYAADDDIVFQHLGTGAGVYDVDFKVEYNEIFVNA